MSTAYVSFDLFVKESTPRHHMTHANGTEVCVSLVALGNANSCRLHGTPDQIIDWCAQVIAAIQVPDVEVAA